MRKGIYETFEFGVAHDLRTPLISIKGLIGLLQKDIETNDGEKIESDMAKINAAADTMGDLLSGLLELSRIGRIINPPEYGSLTELVKKAATNIDDQLRQRGIELKIDEDMPQYWGDSLRLSEVFQNLIENAVKFMGDQPAPRIEISAESGGDMLTCMITDNGIGIHPSYHDRIFNLFERLDPQIEGTGIGMTLVKRIIEAHGGTITIESEGETTGCRVIFTLPANPVEEMAVQESVAV